MAEGDYEKEIFLIAMQSGESPRRVRAQLEKRGLMDVLRNQIIERKVLEAVQKEAKFKDEKYEPQKSDTEAISMAAGGGSGSAIPEVTEAKAGRRIDRETGRQGDKECPVGPPLSLSPPLLVSLSGTTWLKQLPSE